MDKRKVILIHISVWLIFIIGGICRDYFPDKFAGESVFNYSVTQFGYTIVAAICFYGSYFWVAPQLILKRKYLVSFLLTVMLFALVVFARYALEFWFLKPVMNYDNYFDKIPTISYYLTNVFYYYFPGYFVYGLLYFFAESWYKNNQRQQEMQQESLAAELAFLRAQVNPHFLFNTINDIYTLTYQKSEQAPEALLKLSVMLRYMLREGNAALMPLNREVEYLENAIALQKIAAKGDAYINFDQEGYIGEQPVASLLFIAFVENAFKHGVSDDPDHPVQISLKADNNSIFINVYNKKSHGLEDTTGGIGLTNVRRRLELMYPGKHELSIEDRDNSFRVALNLQLN
ncbi:sensor histidine kinase [Pedobacter gandavensis]|uniref:sensor histidine kinase n=1 Tax=Pedobacter gandavensis TaxID=2679963 RepID=UPI00292F85DC|nr:histidine kinase [Pedobacter gandavensis]